MEKMLARLGIEYTDDERKIFEQLEQKQVEYLERLERVNDEKRLRQLEYELQEIENAMSCLSASAKKVTGIKRDSVVMMNNEKIEHLKRKKNPDEEYKEILLEEIANKDLPIVYNVNIGHATPRCIIPFGVDAKVDATQQVIRFS